MKSLKIERNIQAPVDQVYEAWTKPELMNQWFFAGQNMTCAAENDFRVGGQYRLTMKDADAEYVHTGEYKEIEPNKKIVFTWNADWVKGTVVTVSFAGTPGGTALTLVHDFFETDDMRQKHNRGWTGCLESLTRFMKTRVAH